MIQPPAAKPFAALASELSAALGGWQPHSPQKKTVLLGSFLNSISLYRAGQTDSIRENIYTADTTDTYDAAPPRPNPRLTAIYRSTVALVVLSTDPHPTLELISNNQEIADPFLCWIAKWARNIITNTPALEAEDWLHYIHKIRNEHSQTILLDGYNCAIQYSRIWAAGDASIADAVAEHTLSTVDGVLRHIDKQRRLRGVPR